VHCADFLFHLALHIVLTINKETSSAHCSLVPGLVQCRISAQVLLESKKMCPQSGLHMGKSTMVQHFLQACSAAFWSLELQWAPVQSPLGALGLFFSRPSAFLDTTCSSPPSSIPQGHFFTFSSNQCHLGLALLWFQHAAAGL